MDSELLSSVDFSDLLRTTELHRWAAEGSRPLVAVSADGLDDRLDPSAMEQLGSLPAVVVGVVSDPDRRRPEWADLAVSPDSPELRATLQSVGSNPLAAVALALLLRHAANRSIPAGLVAESTAYGLLQGGPEFTTWRHAHPARRRQVPPEPAVLVSRDGEVLSIVLNRPHVLNALDVTMRDGLVEALQIAICDPSVTSIAVSGNGPAFCNGGDLDEFGTRSDPATAHVLRLQRSIGRSLAAVSGRTEVRIHGRTSGSGIELAAFAGRVVADRDTVISLPEVQLGLIPGAGGTVSVPRRIGRHRTMLLALGVPSIDAGTALRWGLVDAVDT